MKSRRPARKVRKKRDVGQTKQGWYQGEFQPTNPSKYKGNKLPFYRSGLELKLMKTLDKSEWCVEWLSEEPKVPYRNPLTKSPTNPAGRIWNYHPDFVITMDEGDGVLITKMIEVKPYKQTFAPKAGGRGRSKKLVESEAKAWAMNSAKWEAAKRFCEIRGWKFIIMTEKDIK